MYGRSFFQEVPLCLTIPFPPLPPTASSSTGERLIVSGVDDVDRFDENEIVMTTSAGTLIVTGESLHIGKLSLDGGELHVDGRIDSLLYEDADRPSGGLLSRLFGG